MASARDRTASTSTLVTSMAPATLPMTSIGEQNLDGEPSWNAGGLQAPTMTTQHCMFRPPSFGGFWLPVGGLEMISARERAEITSCPPKLNRSVSHGD
jgi:hypothetical protein